MGDEPYLWEILTWTTEMAIRPLKYLCAGGEGAAVLQWRWHGGVCLASVTRTDHRKFGVFFVFNLFAVEPPNLWKRVETFPRGSDELTRLVVCALCPILQPPSFSFHSVDSDGK